MYKIIYTAPDGKKLVFTTKTYKIVDDTFLEVKDSRRNETRLIPIKQAEIKVVDDENPQ
jgi:hypothetical protein